MIRIALCDDNKEDMLQLHQKIIEWYRENSKNQSVSITEYSDSVYLSSVIDAGDSHDVFFLDVEMPKVDGFQLADKIRNKLPAAIIVFLTSHSELAPDGYKFRALRYVSKLVLSQKLPEALEAVQKEFSALESGYLVVPHYTDALRIPYNEILYVQHILRSSQIYTLRQGVIKDNRGLERKSTHNRRERPVHGHRGRSRGPFYYRITTFGEGPWDARDPHKTTFMTLK